MQQFSSILERQGESLELLLFKLVETGLLLEAGEARFLPRATLEVERARIRAREIDLLRAATMAEIGPNATLREVAAQAPAPWPAILRDHRQVLSGLVEEIVLVGHRNAALARDAQDLLRHTPVGAGGVTGGRPVRDAELDHLARGAALEAVRGSAVRLGMPDLVKFLA